MKESRLKRECNVWHIHGKFRNLSVWSQAAWLSPLKREWFGRGVWEWWDFLIRCLWKLIELYHYDVCFLECKLCFQLKLKKQNIVKDTDFCPRSFPFTVAALMELRSIKCSSTFTMSKFIKVTDKCFELNITE